MGGQQQQQQQEPDNDKLTPAGPLQVVFQEVATPLTNMHYLGAQRGAMYSAEHNLERFDAEAVARNRCNTPVKNLYLSGENPPQPTSPPPPLSPILTPPTNSSIQKESKSLLSLQ